MEEIHSKTVEAASNHSPTRRMFYDSALIIIALKSLLRCVTEIHFGGVFVDAC